MQVRQTHSTACTVELGVDGRASFLPDYTPIATKEQLSERLNTGHVSLHHDTHTRTCTRGHRSLVLPRDVVAATKLTHVKLFSLCMLPSLSSVDMPCPLARGGAEHADARKFIARLRALLISSSPSSSRNLPHHD